MCVCLKKPFLSVGWIADGVWMGQQQRQGAEIVVSREASLLQGFSSIGLTARLASGQLQPGHLLVGLLRTLQEAERRSQVGDP